MRNSSATRRDSEGAVEVGQKVRPCLRMKKEKVDGGDDGLEAEAVEGAAVRNMLMKAGEGAEGED